jgi:hypothetical protein
MLVILHGTPYGAAGNVKPAGILFKWRLKFCIIGFVASRGASVKYI